MGAVDFLGHDALGAKPASVLGDVFVEQEAHLGVARQPRQWSLAVEEQAIAQILTVMARRLFVGRSLGLWRKVRFSPTGFRFACRRPRARRLPTLRDEAPIARRRHREFRLPLYPIRAENSAYSTRQKLALPCRAPWRWPWRHPN